jgi:hypothetical protein
MRFVFKFSLETLQTLIAIFHYSLSWKFNDHICKLYTLNTFHPSFSHLREPIFFCDIRQQK